MTPEALTQAYRNGYTLISDANPHLPGSELWAAWQTGRSARHDAEEPKTGHERITSGHTDAGRVVVVLESEQHGIAFYSYTA